MTAILPAIRPAIGPAVRGAFDGGFQPSLTQLVRALFSASEPGAWYDPSDMSTLFQDSAGTTPVTAVEQPVGLLLDKSKGLVLGPELVTNGALTSGTGWTDTGVATITYSGAGARIVCPETGWTLLEQGYAGAVNKTYVVDAEVVMHATPLFPAFIAVNIGGLGENLIVSTQMGLIAGNTYRLHGKVRLTSATSFFLRINSSSGQNYALDFTIRNLSVRELHGNHAKQATTTKRPTLSARKNILVHTETLATQSVTTLAAKYILSFWGTGSVTVSGTSAGTLTGTGVGNRVSLEITCTAGTLNLTVSGSVLKAQLEGSWET